MDNPIEAKEKADLSSIEQDGLRNAGERYRCRITVLRKDFREEFYRQHPCGAARPCGRLEEGQVFITSSRWDPPEGFCTWAWGDLRPMIQAIHGGHALTRISCCTDGLRPVTFKLERVDAE